MNLVIKIDKTGMDARLQRIVRGLAGAGRAGLQHAAGVEVQRITADHIAGLKRAPGSFASKFGAPPSNHYAQAAEKVAASSALTSNPEEAVLTINHRGFARAFRDVKIVPRTAKALAIPIHPSAFGKRAAELWDRMGLFIPKGKRVICATVGGVVTPFYILVGSVTQKQDRSLLPSDAAFAEAGGLGVRRYLIYLDNNGKL